MLKNIKKSKLIEYLNNRHNIFFLLILLIISSFIIYLRLRIQIILGPGWDTFDFLLNALEFSGMGFGYYDLSRPPFLSFLTSLFFIFGYISESAIFILDGVIFIFGAIGLYFMLKIRFSNLTSFVGALLFIFNPLLLQWVTIGYSDIASISFLIWGAYFLFNKQKTSSWMMYLSPIFFAFSFLTRYSSALFIFPLLLFFLMEKSSYKLKEIFKYFLMFLLIITPFLIFFYLKFSNPLPFLNVFSSTTLTPSNLYWAFNNDFFYYIKNLFSYVSLWYLGGFVLIFLIMIGFTLTILKITKKSINFRIHKIQNDLKQDSNIIISVILILLFVLTLNRVWYMISELIFIIFCYFFYKYLKDIKLDYKMELFFVSWFVAFLIFHSVYAIKVDRYFISMLPAFLFLVIFGLDTVYRLFKSKYPFKVADISIFLIIVVIILFNIIPSTIWLIANYDHISSSGDMYPEVKEAVYGSKWIYDNVPDYRQKIIYSDFLWPHFSWYLKMKVNRLIIENVTSINRNLNNISADYYLSSYYNNSLNTYKKKVEIGNLTIFEKI
jgi:4-amino-4-deoxy-L-arabinose transferase-like glycosyltransferase